MTALTRTFSTIPASPIHFWTFLHPHPRYGFFLGPASVMGHESNLYLSIEEPETILSDKNADRVLRSIRRRLDLSSQQSKPRFVGVFDFESGRDFDEGLRRLPSRRNPLQTRRACFGDFSRGVHIDLKRRRTVLYQSKGSESAFSRHEHKVREYLARFASKVGTPHLLPVESLRKNAAARFQTPPRKKFFRMVQRVKDHIGRGDIYQANISVRFGKSFSGNAADLYERLSIRNPSPYACLLKMGDTWLASCSPELLLEVKGRRVKTRPIAGTRPRGFTSDIDRRRQGQLLLSPKEKAEHLMLVDLERNDLGKICEPGSVRVSERFTVEKYSHVMHIVSEVQGKLRTGRLSVDAVTALFPGGTITGCPKIKSVEVIERLENVARGPFFGSAGYFAPNGGATFNILIRTALIKNRKIYVQAGAGIVADSRPEREYREVLAKANVLLEAIVDTERE